MLGERSLPEQMCGKPARTGLACAATDCGKRLPAVKKGAESLFQAGFKALQSLELSAVFGYMRERRDTSFPLSIRIDHVKEIALVAFWLHVANQRYKCRSHVKDILKL